MKLISSSKFLLERYRVWENDNNPDLQASARYIYSTANYAKLVEKSPKLEMFVPCDDYSDILKDPIDEELCKYCPIGDWKSNSIGDSCEGSRCEIAGENYLDVFEEAKEKVLFEGWRFDGEADDFIYLKHKDLMLVFDKLTGTFEMISEHSYFIETVEDLTRFDLTLTQTAINKLGL
jgi:hypothetical protein